jgi:hypothetical protein
MVTIFTSVSSEAQRIQNDSLQNASALCPIHNSRFALRASEFGGDVYPFHVILLDCRDFLGTTTDKVSPASISMPTLHRREPRSAVERRVHFDGVEFRGVIGEAFTFGQTFGIRGAGPSSSGEGGRTYSERA